MSKHLTRIISLILALILTLQMTGILDVTAHATEFTDVAMSDTPLSGVSESEILGEDISKREETVKHFRMSDGSWLAVAYPDSVHYQSSGNWEEIDNTMKEDTMELSVPMAALLDEPLQTMSAEAKAEIDTEAEIDSFMGVIDDCYVNTSNDFIVRLPKTLSETSWVGTSNTAYDLYFRFLGIDSASAVVGAANSEESPIQAAGNEIPRVNTASSISYPNILPGVNVVYNLNGQQLKENIVFSRLDNTPDTLSFVIWAEGLELESLEDGSFVFLAGDDPQFYIPAPFLMDSDGECSGEVTVETEEIESCTYQFTYALDQEWLRSEDRVWPVILDPITCAEMSRSEIQDTYIREGYPQYCYADAYYFYTGYFSSPSKAVRSFIQHTSPPVLNSGDIVISAYYQTTGRIDKGTSDMQVNAYAITSSWDEGYVNGNRYPSTESTILDYQIIQYDSARSWDTYSWDITSVAQRWYSMGASASSLDNFGIMLRAPEVEAAGDIHTAQFYAANGSEEWPALIIKYRNSTGLESYWDYTSLDAGRAGTISTNNYTGNLVVTRTDLSYSGNRMPASMTFTYNANDYNTNIGYGKGWRSNYSQTVKSATILGVSYYCWTDGDGTRIYFRKDDDGIWKDENGLSYTLDVLSSGFKITDRDNNQLVFDSNGRLTQVIDGNISDNKIQITYVSGVTTPKISSVTDGAGRKYLFSYGTDGNLSSLQYTGSGSTALETVNYTYSSNQLTKVTYADTYTATYTYSNGHMATATGCQNDSVSIAYGTGDTVRVKKLTSKDGSTTVSSATFMYGDNYTKVTDNNSRWVTYQFNNAGNTVSVYNQQGQAVYGTYSEKKEDSDSKALPNQLLTSSRLQDTVTNLLSPRSYTSSWSKSVSVTAGKAYTLSGTGTGDTSKQLKITVSGKVYVSESVTTGRTEVTAVVPNGVTSITVSGTGAFQDLQLEQAESASRYNMLYDTDMTAIGNWTGANISSGDGKSTAQTDSRANLNTASLLIKGEGSKAKQYTQTLTASGSSGDQYTFGVWTKASSVPLSNSNYPDDTSANRRFGIQVRLLNGSTVVEEKYVPANDTCTEWQFISGSVQADAAYTKVEVALVYDHNANSAYFDGAQLFKERFAYIYTYDENGRIETVTDLEGNKTTYTYLGDSSDIAKITMPNNAEYSYTYNSSNLLTGTTSATGVQTTHEYDAYGNNEQTTITYSDNTGRVIQSNQTYTSDGNFLDSVTGNDQNTVTYIYNTENSTLTSVTDARGNETSNTYDTMRRLKSVTSGGASANYTYTIDRLTKLKHSGGSKGTTYCFSYTTAGLTDQVHVNYTHYLVDNAYNTGTWTLASQTYGNGDAWRYTYNTYDDLVSAYTTGGDTGTELKYFYNSEGALARIEQYDTTLSAGGISSRVLTSTERYYYDSADRMTRITRTDSDGDAYACEWSYDYNNNVTAMTETVNGVTVEKTYTYDNDQRLTSVTSGSTTVAYAYDNYGRLASQTTKHGSTVIQTETFEYRNIDSTHTTTQVSKLTVTAGGSSTVYEYTYDANGNITQIKDATNNTFINYTYDSLNQLTREKNQAAGKIWDWTYDTGGNITSRKESNYTTNAQTDSTAYTYSSSVWGDLLMKYDGGRVLTDEIGNTLQVGTRRYDWQGRQLSSIEEANSLGITKQPEDFVGMDGDSLSFTVGAMGTGLTYQWQRSDDDGATWKDSTSASSTTPTITDFTLTNAKDGRIYRCKVTDSSGNVVYSEPARMIVAAIVVDSHPADVYGVVGDAVSFSVTARGTGLSYQWEVSTNGGERWSTSGATGNTTNTISDFDVTEARAGNMYRCKITDSKGNVTYSEAGQIILSGARITAQPEDFFGFPGDEVSFSIGVSGTGLSYQWQVSTNGGRSWANSGATGCTTTAISNFDVTEARLGNQYRCAITDADGNVIYSEPAELRTVTKKWSYTYDSDGLRTAKSDGATNYEYIYDGDKLVQMNVGSDVLRFAYDGSTPMTVTFNGAVYYYITNLQGDIIAILDSTGSKVVEYTYNAWGLPLTTTGTMANTLGQKNPLRYRGYVYDTETGLYYVSSRYYDPEIGRFINADAVDLLGANGDFASLNLFAYCGNNPVARVDSNGHFWEAIGIGFAAGIVGQYISDVIGNIQSGQTGVDIFAPTSSASDYLASGIGGAIAAIPGLNLIGTMGVGAVGSVVSDGLKGNINNWEDLGKSALKGGVANGIGYGVAKGMAALKVKQIGNMPRSSRKVYLRDNFYRNSQANANINLKTFANSSMAVNIGIVETQVAVFRSGVYSTVTSTFATLF